MAATMHYGHKLESGSEQYLPLRDIVRQKIKLYYKNMKKEGMDPEDVYRLIIEETEVSLIEATMEYTEYNQCRSARILGLNRGTFRKKLEHYGMIKLKS